MLDGAARRAGRQDVEMRAVPIFTAENLRTDVTSSPTAIESQPAVGERPDPARASRRRLDARHVLALAAWCGLVGGWLEVATRVLCKSLIGNNRLYMMTRHFVWLVPLSNLLLFLAGGLLLAAATKASPRLSGWLSPRVLCASALMPALLVVGPQIYSWAWLMLALGIACRLVPRLERLGVPSQRWLVWGFSGLLSLVLITAVAILGGDWIAQRREDARPLPPADSPNVLLIVLDTVRADRMSVYGYPRPTTPALDRLAQRAVLFTEARATAPWTLASHASMFSGRLPHELNVQWMTALQDHFPTLAEDFGDRGYATAGFAANIGYCSHDTGLDRGFTHYEDYWADLEHLRPLRTAVLFQGAWDLVLYLGRLPRDRRLKPALEFLAAPYRKDAAMVNRQFTRWLSERREAHRPFFAFLNYYDTHVPYVPPQGTPPRFGTGPRTLGDFHFLIGLWDMIDKSRVVPHYTQLLQDSYDNCLAYLDEQLGNLFETLKSRGVLDHTVVIITSDHGEELGEHGLFEHGESLYRPETRVPLLVLLPGRAGPAVVVREPVSLLDLPATIAELSGRTGVSPFPGRSLARLWRDPSPEDVPGGDDAGPISELSAPNPTNPSHGRSPAARGPLISLVDGHYLYICNQRDGREQLFHTVDDPGELVNLARMESMQPRLERFRQRLTRISAASGRRDR
jgi:arylsulfatase A-like enzyme